MANVSPQANIGFFLSSRGGEPVDSQSLMPLNLVLRIINMVIPKRVMYRVRPS